MNLGTCQFNSLTIFRINKTFQALFRVLAILIESRAIVIIPFRFREKLDKLRDKLGSPAGLCTLHGGFANDDSNVVEKIKYEFGKIDGVVAHGGLIRSDTLGTGVVGKLILKVSPEEVLEDTRILLRLHLTAAQALIPMLESKIGTESWESYPTYTFLTGELRAKETSVQAEGHVLTSLYGLGLSLRADTTQSQVKVNELHIALHLNESDEERMHNAKRSPSLDLGLLTAYHKEKSYKSLMCSKGMRYRVQTDEELLLRFSKVYFRLTLVL